jgi:hypothetical protein
MRAFLAIVALVVWTGYWFFELFLHNRVRAIGRYGPDPMLQALVWVAGVIVIVLVARFVRRRAGEG